ncbi:acetate--CoA ligase family protein [Mycolicibacterium arenosum]|uniref:Acetate--CoA ligase family protein n=1 Tax=Mycolicibacterium arenosum TaxID=2952157 RepID=A0ABT1M093_9MYCO|nr:acetate--CoA ligase family protein [Mycolicibacterium sp. CAU 1645]MCP9272010.1 acetate--CoA ligase family protein [Mycolicibacterium sp. CAU 1645]
MDARRTAVAAMLGARSVALVGASARPDSLGARMIVEARRSSARMHLVNPRYSDIDGTPCAPTLADLDEPVDLVLLGVPDSALVEQLEAAAAAGVRGAVLFGGAHGLRDKVAAVAAESGMALCGAGCMGFVNNALGLRALGYLEPDPLPVGGISLITHSGSAFSTLLRAHRGFGFRMAVSSGQELVTDAADYVEYALDDPGTDVVALLLESPRAMPRLRSALLRAAEQGVPVIVLPVGGSPTGRVFVAAHSGALAGEGTAWRAFCESVGAVMVGDLAEFTDTIELFAAGRRPRDGVGSGAIATVHDSGAERALTADVAHTLGVEFADLSPKTVESISDLLDDGLVTANPLDVWGTGADTRRLFRACLRVLTDDPEVAVTALAVDLVTEYDGDTAYADAVLDVASDTPAPLAVLTSVPSAVDRATADRLRSNGIPVLEGTRSGLAALGHLARWPRPVDTHATTVDGDRRRRWLNRLAGWDPRLAFTLLSEYDVPVAEARSACTLEDVLAAAEVIGYPVALKTLGAEHKSDIGGVILGIDGPAVLHQAYADLAVRLGPEVIVQAMAETGVEISVGIVRDAVFGPLLVLAAGGTLVEVLADRVVTVPPVSPKRVLELLAGLRVKKMLDGWRGSAPADVLAVARAIAAFSTIATELGDAVEAVEANPIVVTAAGAVAVDALVYPRTTT